MQVLEKIREVETSGVGQVFKATIKASAKVFSFFSDQTYTDKPRTIIREYTANGVDEHNQSGNPTARMLITLPTEDDPTLHFRDFGRGMSHDFITGPFMAYADGSTKTSDNVAIGGLGIGSKSGFAYTDQFVIRSIHGGMSRTYSMFKDEEGVPGIALLDEQRTSEPSGCEVIIPIETPDFDRFKEAAEEVLGYFNPQPELIGGTIKQPNYVATGPNWAVRKEAGDLAVIMGGVRYPVAKSSLPWDVRNDDLVSYGIDLTMPIGSCSVALSREALSMDDATTSSVIRALRDCKDDIVASFATMFDGYASKWQASKALGEMEKGNTARYRVLSSNAKYRGQDLHKMYRCEGIEASVHNTRGRRSTISKFDWIINPMMQPANVKALILDDLPDDNRKRLLARVRAAYACELGHSADIVVVRGGSLQRMLEKLGNPTKYVLASTLAVPAAAPRARGVRTAQRVFTHSYGGYSKGDLRELADVTGRDVLVAMDNYVMPANFHGQWAAGLVARDRVVFANKMGAADLRKTGKFIEWADAYAKAREEVLGKADSSAAHIKWMKTREPHLAEHFAYIARVRRHLGTLTPAQQKRPFGKIVDLYDRYYSAPEPEGYAVIKAKCPPRLNTKRLVEALETQQTKLDHVLKRLVGRYSTPEDLDVAILKDYI